MNSNLKKFLQFLGSITLGGVILYLAANKLKPDDLEWAAYGDKIWDGFKQTNYWWIALSCAFALISHFSRSLRWRMLIAPMGKTPSVANSFFAIMIAYLVNLAFPRAGEVARCGIIYKYEKIPFQKLLGTAVADRVFDVIILLLMTFIALLLAWNEILDNIVLPLSESIQAKFADNMWLLIIGAVLGIAILFAAYKLIMRTALKDKIINILLGFKEGLLTVKKLDKPWLFVVHTIIIWICYILMIYVCFKGYPDTLNLGFAAGLVVLVFASFGMVAPTPGGMGAFQAMVTLALVSLYGITEEPAFAFSLIIFIAQQGLVLVVGFLSIILLPRVNKSVTNEELEPTAA